MQQFIKERSSGTWEHSYNLCTTQKNALIRVSLGTYVKVLSVQNVQDER